MSAEIIPFPEPRSYLDYCRSPEKRDIARRMYKQLAEDMPEAAAERITMDLMKGSEEIAARILSRRGPPPAS